VKDHPVRARLLASLTVVLALVAGCTSDGAGENGNGTEPNGQSEAPQVAPLESVVVIEPIDAPLSQAEIRVGELIIEFDGQVTDEGTLLTIEEPILFDFDSAELKPESREALDDIADVLAFYETAPVVVVGHTDNVGSREYNVDLSQRRARAVVDALSRRGIAADRLTFEGRAFDEPVASNDTDEGRQQNRRVEVLIVGVEPPAAGD
jgi:outer membrane protein OmpA-like peptidoglycan-associated protein